MRKLFTVILYILWTISLIGILVVTFTNFQYEDLNTLIGVILFFTLLNTFFYIKTK